MSQEPAGTPAPAGKPGPTPSRKPGRKPAPPQRTSQGAPSKGQPAKGQSVKGQPKASWLEGPASALPPAGSYPGERLGLPHDGVGAMAGYGIRILALLLDWFASSLVAYELIRFAGLKAQSRGVLTLGVFIVEVVFFVTLMNASFGQAICGLRVLRVDNHARPGFFRALMRTLLLAIVIPAVVTDRDGRGLHDRAVNTVLIRARG